MFSAFIKISSLNKKTVITYQVIQLLPWSSLESLVLKRFLQFTIETHTKLSFAVLTKPNGSSTSFTVTSRTTQELAAQVQAKRFPHHSSDNLLQVAHMYNSTYCDLVEID
jgi:hypothetical protein